MEYSTARALSAQRLNLFDCEPRSMTDNLQPGPRDASADEVRAYLRWLAHKSGLFPFDVFTIEHSGWQGGGRNARQLTYGITFGACVKMARGGDAPEYETGAYSVPMPGRIARPVTMETLDGAGGVVASSMMPTDSKRLVVWSRDMVRAACGPMPKRTSPARAKVKAAPAVLVAAPSR